MSRARRTSIASERSARSCSCCVFPTARSRCWSKGRSARASFATWTRRTTFWSRPRRSKRVVRRSTEIEALMRSINSTFEHYVKLNKKIPPEMIMSVASIDDPARLADTIVAHLGHQARGQAGAARDREPGRAARTRARLHALGDRDSGGGEAHPHAGQEADGEDPEGVLPQRADAGDPEGARREGRVQERDPGARGAASSRRRCRPRRRRRPRKSSRSSR